MTWNDEWVVITRESAEATKPGRVFITGPHFSQDIYSSTPERAGATVYARSEAERLLALGKWRIHDPRIEPA